MDEPKYVAETLAWCNARRKERGKEPLENLPKGERHLGNSCPCGRATGLHVGANYYGDNAAQLPHRLPRAVAEFVHDFDEGYLPQYEAKP